MFLQLILSYSRTLCAMNDLSQKIPAMIHKICDEIYIHTHTCTYIERRWNSYPSCPLGLDKLTFLYAIISLGAFGNICRIYNPNVKHIIYRPPIIAFGKLIGNLDSNVNSKSKGTPFT